MRQAMSSDVSFEDAAPFRGLDALLWAALETSPGASVLRDDRGSLTTRDFAARVQMLARSCRQCGLRPGERVLLVAGATIDSLAALFATLRAGLEPALAPCGLGPVELAACARAADVVALVGPTRYGALSLGDAYLSTAALCDSIRLVATLGPEAVDGAADFSGQALEAIQTGSVEPFGAEGPIIVTFEGPASAPVPVSHRQSTLGAAALTLIEQARIGSTQPLVTTIMPASLAGLVAGPYAALIGASGLVMHGPFDAAAFLAACDAAPSAPLVAPAEMGPMLRAAGIGVGESALILLSRFSSPASFVLPQSLQMDRPVVDLHAFGETAVLARHRAGGVAQAPPELSDGSLPSRLGVALNRARSEGRALGAAGG